MTDWYILSFDTNLSSPPSYQPAVSLDCPEISFQAVGYGEFMINYTLDSANCNLDLVIDGHQVSLSLQCHVQAKPLDGESHHQSILN